MTAYYNEIDPKAAAWLRELIKQNLIAPGDVDERSIEDVKPNDLKEYTQCHFFAGIGVWSYALRQAGWSDDKPIWTGSCPCQPFSSAGKGKGFDDERHLWPAWYWLIEQCVPDTIIGEQVERKNGLAWFDHVSTDMERIGYSCGQIAFPACSVGAPHQRQRLYWLADDSCIGRGRRSKEYLENNTGIRKSEDKIKRSGDSCELANNNSNRCEAGREVRSVCEESNTKYGNAVIELADNDGLRCQRKCRGGEKGTAEHSEISQPTATNGWWRNVDWLYCRDGKWRPVEPGTFPLANGFAERVGLIRGFGNGLVAPQAKIFIEACQEILC